MANAATITVGITATPDPGNNVSISKTITYAPSGNDTLTINQVATTTPANLSLGSLTTSTCKQVVIRASTDNTGTVLVSIFPAATDYTFARLVAGDVMTFPMEDSSIIRVTASATTQEIFISAFQD